MRNKSGLLLISVLLLVMLPISGCGKKPEVSMLKVVAKINNYELTTEDFREEARLALARQYPIGESDKAKEDLLDEMIVKKLLIQEAQAHNFDKDRAFMKEIERYWEQALLKLLIKNKIQEFAQHITVDEDEVKKEYDRIISQEGSGAGSFEKLSTGIRSDLRRKKINDAFNNWISGLKSKSNVKVYKENLKYIVVK
ncbi:MAG: hypothetical protein WC738_02580 [Candidatus Omnitrophota bacterium]|jgi:hypothetical protein